MTLVRIVAWVWVGIAVLFAAVCASERSSPFAAISMAMSAIAACPLSYRVLSRIGGVLVPGWGRIGAAVTFFLSAIVLYGATATPQERAADQARQEQEAQAVQAAGEATAESQPQSAENQAAYSHAPPDGPETFTLEISTTANKEPLHFSGRCEVWDMKGDTKEREINGITPYRDIVNGRMESCYVQRDDFTCVIPECYGRVLTVRLIRSDGTVAAESPTSDENGAVSVAALKRVH